jgi:hypothetical protein
VLETRPEGSTVSVRSVAPRSRQAGCVTSLVEFTKTRQANLYRGPSETPICTIDPHAPLARSGAWDLADHLDRAIEGH